MIYKAYTRRRYVVSFIQDNRVSDFQDNMMSDVLKDLDRHAILMYNRRTILDCAKEFSQARCHIVIENILDAHYHIKDRYVGEYIRQTIISIDYIRANASFIVQTLIDYCDTEHDYQDFVTSFTYLASHGFLRNCGANVDVMIKKIESVYKSNEPYYQRISHIPYEMPPRCSHICVDDDYYIIPETPAFRVIGYISLLDIHRAKASAVQRVKSARKKLN